MGKLLLLLLLWVGVPAAAQSRKSPHDTISTKGITVTYGRPYVHERVIFGQLVKYDQVWRVGADEATTIRFDQATLLGDKEIPAGTYTMFAKVFEDHWAIIINTVLGQWGSFSYEKNKPNDIAYIDVPVRKLEAQVEQMTIRFAEDGMIIEWENTGVLVPVTLKK